jgi:hypothetical protein
MSFAIDGHVSYLWKLRNHENKLEKYKHQHQIRDLNLSVLVLLNIA